MGSVELGPPGLPPDGSRSVITVGTFDGIHRGHWEVLQRLRRSAREHDGRAVLVTFHPHPLRIVRPQDAPPLLTTPLEKKEILAEAGLDYAVFLPFTPALSRYEPDRFVRELLIDRFRLAHLVIGYDHGFGRGRSGDPDRLREIGRRLGFQVEVVPAVHLDGEPISSTLIRNALLNGDVVAAARGLGRAYSVRATVVRGDGRGRRLGFPTANLQVPSPDKLLPRAGVYAARALLPPAAPGPTRTLDGVLHLGPRPTFRGSPPALELHLFDFDGDLYGLEIRVDFCARLRDIHRFGSVGELVDAIRGDCAAARQALRAGGTACRDG